MATGGCSPGKVENWCVPCPEDNWRTKVGDDCNKCPEGCGVESSAGTKKKTAN